MKQDFHMHSNYSNDGEFSPKELCEKAKKCNCQVLALTDHNSVKGVDEMINAGKKLGLRVVPGIEIDTVFDGIDFHLLVYGMDYSDDRYKNLEEYYIKQEQYTTKAMVKKFEEAMNIKINEDKLKKIEKNGIIVPEDLAELLLNDDEYKEASFLTVYRSGKERSNNPYLNFYLDYFAQGKIAYIKAENIAIDDVLEIVKETGGLACIAHPGHNFKNAYETLEKLVSKPGIQGIEAYSNYHTQEDTAKYCTLANNKNLIITCGSDFHGKNKPAIKLGDISFVPTDFVSKIAL